MWSPHQTPEPIEKIRKAQWTAENTATTQAVVDELEIERKALRRVTGNSKVVEAMTASWLGRKNCGACPHLGAGSNGNTP